jgi:hypothetical protein
MLRRVTGVENGNSGQDEHLLIGISKEMKRVIVSLFCSVWLAAAYADQPKPDELWALIAESQIVATGMLEVPVAEIRSRIESHKPEYVGLILKNAKALKGSAPSEIPIRWYTDARGYALRPERIISLNGRNAVLFLIKVDEESVKGFYFAGDTPKAIADADAGFLEKVRAEVSAQEQILKSFDNRFPPANEPLYQKVKDEIDATTRKSTQMGAFRQLEQLGEKGVPAIIMQMDDRRDLAIHAISLQNKSPEAWEACRQYGPVKVVDAMSAILTQITGLSFGNIDNGGSERERRATVDGWRVYLYHLKR